ncbi:amidohydrolase family protein [Flagellimonas amoyensis]|uniref:amidohydrolase family protein n=1 Tax=Flagellimonas amoyensis TaxID=2169401 RepID=UPI000D39D4CB|nr:amidohydrolase family protein [Allomuricauda amoyensis]
MTRKHLLACAFLISTFSLFAQTYITHVTVADVEKQRLLPDQTVVITDGLISSIKKSSTVKIPQNATVIDGRGKFLFPGLVDAHIHFSQNGGLYTRPDAIDLRKYMDYNNEIALARSDMETKLRRYLQNGITTVVDVGSSFNLLDARNGFKDNATTAQIFMTGPLLTTYEPAALANLGNDGVFTLTKTIEEGIKGVQQQLPHQPDFIKIWYIAGADGLSVEESARKNLPIVNAIIEEAHKHNLKVAVHATERITAQLAVENGADFLVHSVDDEVITDDFVALLKKNNVALCPTLVVPSGYMDTFGQKLELGTHDLQKADPYQLGTLLDLKHLPETSLIENYKKYANDPKNVEKLQKSDSISRVNLKKLSDAGVLIVTGTDAGNIGTLHTSSYLPELKAMQESGMSNWKIMQASTVNGAKLFGKENEFGTVTTGKKANLLLLDANPIVDIENVTQIHTVFNQGEAFKPNDLLQDSPTDLAQRQLNAYNLGDIEAFLEPYAEDVEVYAFPDQLLYKGKETMRGQYAQMFKNTPDLHCELKERIVQGNVVIDKERVQFGTETVEAVAMYHVENGKIKKVYFIQ